MKNKVKKTITAFVLTLGASVWNASAMGIIYPSSQPVWANGSLAAACGFVYPTLQPLSQQRNLIAEDSLPNGSVLYSWGYDNFAPDFSASCRGEGTYNTPFPAYYPELRITDRLDFNGLKNDLLAGEWLWPTNNSGVALKLYITLTSRGDQSTGYTDEKSSRSTYISNTSSSVPAGQEFAVRPSFGTTSVIDGTMNSILSGNQSGITDSAHYFRYSVRGELIKTGNVQTGIPLSLSPAADLFHAFFMNNTAAVSQAQNIGAQTIPLATVFGEGGITFVKPACRLRGATDYDVSLGEWSNMTSLPAYGDTHLIDINIECNGSVDNVEFSFQDTGSASLSNRNLGLYDSVDGQVIEGLEIEMTYNGGRLDIHKYNESPDTYKVNVGSHGSIKTDASDLSFNSQSQARFGARFIQRSAIKRNGNFYTGPVVGKVNMFVTYY